MTEARHILGALAGGSTVSGAALAAELGVSRTRVWQLVGELRGHGYDVRTRPGRGYEWRNSFEPLSVEPLARDLPRGWSLDVVWETDSTSNRILADRPDGGVLFAEHQSGGRGRVGRQWASPPGGLYLSAGRWFRDLGAGPQRLSPWIASQLVAALRRLDLVGVGAKWPNDLVRNGSKLGGILIELAGDPFGNCYVAVGVGLNWHCPGIADQPAAGIGHAVPAGVGRNDVGACCVAAVTTALDEYASRDAREVVEAWREVDAWRGVTLTFSHGGGRVAGQVDGIDPDGSLRLITPDGLRRFAAGELHLDPQ